MWTAWHLLDSEPGIRVLLLEGDVCGHGPSGRNGGFCESLWLSAPALRERFGDEAARSLLDASSETVTAIGAWCEDNEVDAWFDQSGYLCVSTSLSRHQAPIAPTFSLEASSSARAGASPKRSLIAGALSQSDSQKPPFRPLGPCPQTPPSSRRTRIPGSESSRCQAVHIPV